MIALPPVSELTWTQQYRVIPSTYPPIDFFEKLVEPELMGELYAIAALTNARLRDEAGDISLVTPEDRVSGSGSSPVMGAFTHIGTPSRFSDGSYGVYYAAKEQHTAIEETIFHRARFLSYTAEEPGEIEMQTYIGEVAKMLHDIRDVAYETMHDPDDWTFAQELGAELRGAGSWGLVYNSVRDPGGECIAALRPPAVTIPRRGPHLAYVWDGHSIVKIYEKRLVQ